MSPIAAGAELAFRPLEELAGLVRTRQLAARELVGLYLDRIAALDPGLGAYLHVDEAGALGRADELDARVARGEDPGPLCGVPLALKDVLATRGVPTTAGSRILEGWVPPYDATAWSRLQDAGAILLGKLNLDEFAMGSSTENSAYHPTRNPWDPARVPGGSSGGSAAAVSAGLCAASLGSDTGGSIRQPAALCGIVGLKPTYGRVSRHGLIAFASSLDQIGPMTRSVRDAALLLEVIAGRDPADATSIDAPVPGYRQRCDAPVAGLRIGLPEEYFGPGLDPEVEAAVRAALERLAAEGARVTPVSLPHTPQAIATYHAIATAEASSNLARYDGVRYGHRSAREGSLHELYARSRGEGFGREVKRRILLGTYALRAGHAEAMYRRAQQVRALVARDFERAFTEVDVLATPTAPTPAFPLGEKTSDPLAMYLADVFTIGASLAGLPGISLPCGVTSGGLPVGLQLLGRPLDEGTLFAAAAAYERLTGWHLRRPPGASS